MNLKQIAYHFILIVLLFGCKENETIQEKKQIRPNQYITVLGIAQDAGYPHIDCNKVCCEAFYKGKEIKKHVTSLGFIDQLNNEKYLFEATPDITHQLQELNTDLPKENIIDGIFLTHAHIGHYTGLMYFGREAKGAKEVPVYAMPKMTTFLYNNAPWNQLTTLKNIKVNTIQKDSIYHLNDQLAIQPLQVPHRDEFSETVGYKIFGAKKTALFIPDINKWELWDKDIIEEVEKVDYAFLDATFFSDGEIPRPMNEVPHPFIEETVKLFSKATLKTKSKVIFIHFNHSNPAIKKQNKLKKAIEKQGFKFAEEGDIYDM